MVEHKKKKTYYVRRSPEDLVKRGIENSKHVQKILLEITNINMELLREGHHDGSDERVRRNQEILRKIQESLHMQTASHIPTAL